MALSANENCLWLAGIVARCIQKELNVRAVSILRIDSDHSIIPQKLSFQQLAKASANESWNRLTKESYSYEETWGLTGVAFLNRKTVHVPFYQFSVVGPANVAKSIPPAQYGHANYVKVFENWFKERLNHILVVPICLGSEALGAIKVLNRLGSDSVLIRGEAPFEIREQSFCAGLADLLARDWGPEGLKPVAEVKTMVMLSYSHRDMALCDVVEAAIRADLPDISILRDTEIEPGTRVSDEIHRMIKTCSVAIFLLTKSGVESSWVQREWLYAEHDNVPLLPVVEECMYMEAKERFPGLAERKPILFKIEGYRELSPAVIRAIKKAKAASGSGV